MEPPITSFRARIGREYIGLTMDILTSYPAPHSIAYRTKDGPNSYCNLHPTACHATAICLLLPHSHRCPAQIQPVERTSCKIIKATCHGYYYNTLLPALEPLATHCCADMKLSTVCHVLARPPSSICNPSFFSSYDANKIRLSS